MMTPTAKGDPGKVSDPEFWCDETDGGGVHSNSGVPNHAYALMTELEALLPDVGEAVAKARGFDCARQWERGIRVALAG